MKWRILAGSLFVLIILIVLSSQVYKGDGSPIPDNGFAYVDIPLKVSGLWRSSLGG
jgi:hypothetical protein